MRLSEGIFDKGIIHCPIDMCWFDLDQDVYRTSGGGAGQLYTPQATWLVETNMWQKGFYQSAGRVKLFFLSKNDQIEDVSLNIQRTHTHVRWPVASHCSGSMVCGVLEYITNIRPFQRRQSSSGLHRPGGGREGCLLRSSSSVSGAVHTHTHTM